MNFGAARRVRTREDRPVCDTGSEGRSERQDRRSPAVRPIAIIVRLRPTLGPARAELDSTDPARGTDLPVIMGKARARGATACDPE